MKGRQKTREEEEIQEGKRTKEWSEKAKTKMSGELIMALMRGVMRALPLTLRVLKWKT